MTNREHIVKILIREVSQAEKHQRHMTAEEIRVREALLWLADRIDYAEKPKSRYQQLKAQYSQTQSENGNHEWIKG